MKLVPGAIVEYDWNSGVVHVVEEAEDGTLEVREKPIAHVGVRLIDTKTGEEVDEVATYNVMTRLVVRYVLRNGKPFVRVCGTTDNGHIAVIVERRELRAEPIEGWKPDENEV